MFFNVMRARINRTCYLQFGIKCIEVYKCPYFASLLKEKIKSKSEIIEEVRRQHCGFVGTIPAVCCEEKENQENQKTEQNDYVHKNVHLLPTNICGPVAVDPRIANGKKSGLNEFPWMAMLVYRSDEGVQSLCSGSLISERYVLTAAHCILDTLVGIRLGEYNIETFKDCDPLSLYCSPPVQDMHIDKVIVHPEYKKKITEVADIALVRLAEPANMSFDNVRPICLPLAKLPNMNKRLFTITGWGTTETGFKSTFLQKASVPLIPLNECDRIYKYHLNITSSVICAGGGEEDACNGDSGGPLSLIVPLNGRPRYIQYGIVSIGPKSCGTNGMPGIYSRVDSYLSWILDNLEK